MSAARFSRDVSATLGELEKWVFAAYPAARREGGSGFLIDSAGATLRLTATPGPLRRIALLALPTLTLEYEFSAGDTAERAAVLKRLDMFMHRGGG